MNQLISLQAAIDLIKTGTFLSLAGSESTLDKLPAGNWIGGTIPYFMLAEGGTVVRDDRLFATDLSQIGSVSLACYPHDGLDGITAHAPDNGFSQAIIPAGSQAHQRFSEEAANYKDAFIKPTVGWISGIHLDDFGKATPKVYDGRTASKHDNHAVVAYVTLPADKMACVDIVNLFEPDVGDVLTFTDTSFTVGDCLVNGEKVNFANYAVKHGLEQGKLPLVGDYAGAHVNVSLQKVDAAKGEVTLYAPVFPGVDYRFAKPVPDYAGAFVGRLANQDASGAVVSCNCILNFLFGELEGKVIGGIQGPATFGEIAYQLVNQTMVTVRVL
jgi:hypothetical protein